ncbi:DNA polymerase III subunit delta', partial [termite gut metagenome]
MFFKDVIGQTPAKELLLAEAKEDRIPHARLICGSEGIGKFPLALAYARYINCTAREDTNACGKCPSCVKFNKLVHPDVHFIFPIVKSAKRKKELCEDYITEWRKFILSNPYFNLNYWLSEIEAENSQALIYAGESDEIIKKLSLKSSEGRYKFVFIWLPEKMHAVCANKLLKLLEEPPEKTIFLLISEAPEMILPTILSRTQRFNVRKIEEESIAEVLRNKLGVLDADS